MTSDKNLHILVVDDDPDSLGTIVEYLSSLGYKKITQASNGAEAIRIIDHDNTINFVISDWDMPVMSGAELLRQIRNKSSRAHLPFLMVTSPVSHEYEKVMMAAENLVNAYIIKPFRIHTLQEKIDYILQLSIHGPTKKVVVADDDPDARQMVVEYLKVFGFKEVIAFENGHDAIAYLKKEHPQVGLIVSDWEMPGMSGLELLRSCKQNSALSEIPFLMITSQSSMEQMKVIQAAKSHVDQYLLKPFNSTQLKDRVDVVIEKYRNRSEVQKFLRQGNEHLDHGRYEKAEAAFSEALQLDPNNEYANRGMADAVIKYKGIDAALPFYKKAINSNPYLVSNYIKLSASYEQLGLYDKAIASLKSGLDHISFSSDLHFHLGQLFWKKNLAVQAKTEFEKTLELQPGHQEAQLMIEMIAGTSTGPAPATRKK